MFGFTLLAMANDVSERNNTLADMHQTLTLVVTFTRYLPQTPYTVVRIYN